MERCEELLQEILEAKSAKTKLEKNNKAMELDMEKLKSENAILHQYITKMDEFEDFKNNNNCKPISQLSPKQRQRKITELKTKSERAL